KLVRQRLGPSRRTVSVLGSSVTPRRGVNRTATTHEISNADAMTAKSVNVYSRAELLLSPIGTNPATVTSAAADSTSTRLLKLPSPRLFAREGDLLLRAQVLHPGGDNDVAGLQSVGHDDSILEIRIDRDRLERHRAVARIDDPDGWL